MSAAPPALSRLDARDEAEAVLAALASDRPLAVVTRIDGAAAGARLLVDVDDVRGTLGDAALDEAAARLAREALTNAGGAADSHAIGEARLLVQVHRAAPRAFIVGAGHISVPLARIAATAGFSVTVLDDREEFADAARFDDGIDVRRMDLSDPFGDARPDERAFVVLVTRAHAHDFDCLRDLLRSDPMPRYVGMIGSRRRVRAAFAALLDEGVPRDRLALVRAPLGLDIGAQTPEEIAVSVVAEMIAVRRGAADRDDAGAPLSAREGVLDRFFPADR